MSWLFHRWFLLTRAMTLGVRGLVLNASGEVLLVRHSYTPGWHMPGGGVEIGETLLDALAKELREEAGVRLGIEPQLHGMFFNRQLGSRDHVAVFVVRDFAWDGPPPPSREIVESGFFAIDALPEETTAATRRRLREVLHGLPRGQDW